MEKIEHGDILNFIYTNHKGETDVRKMIVDQLFLGSNEWHPKKQFLISGFDLDKGSMRCYAMKDMRHIVIEKNKWELSKSV